MSAGALAPPGMVVLFLDASHFSPITDSSNVIPNALTEPLIRTASSVIRGLPEQAPVAIYSSNIDFHVVRDFAIENHSGQIVYPKLSAEQIQKATHIFEQRISAERFKIKLRITDLLTNELAQLESIADHVAKLPGRKALIWFCEGTGFHVPPREGVVYNQWFSAITAAQRANLAVYTVACNPRVPELLHRMAEITGGRFYDTSDQLPKAMRQALQDSRCSYELSWKPQHADRRPIHSIKIETRQSGIHLVYPDRYVEPLRPRRLDLRLKAAEAAFVTPLDAHSVGVNAEIMRQDEDMAAVLVSIDRDDIKLMPDGGRLRGLLDIIYAYFDGHGNRIHAGSRNTITFDLTEQQNRADMIRNRQYTLTENLVLPPNARTLRIAIRDGNSGALGSTTLHCEAGQF